MAARKRRNSPDIPRPSIADGDLFASRLRLTSRLPGMIYGQIRSGISPRGQEPRKWYDRTIRIIGGILFVLLLGGMVAAMWVSGLQK